MEKNIRNIVFDVGMVLIDFCWVKHCHRLGFDEEVIQAFETNMINSRYWELMDEGMIQEKDAIHEFIKKMPMYQKEIQRFWEQPEYFVEEYAYSTPMILELKKKEYKVYLLSNYPLDLYKRHWPAFSFYSFVDGFVVSAVERLKKPDPAIYKLLCDRYQLKAEECLFIDDRQINVDAAIKVGMQAVLFQGERELKKYLGLK